MFESSEVIEPYCVVVPYSTCELSGTFVVQLMVPEEVLKFPATTLEIVTAEFCCGELPCTVPPPPQPTLAATANKARRKPALMYPARTTWCDPSNACGPGLRSSLWKL